MQEDRMKDESRRAAEDAERESEARAIRQAEEASAREEEERTAAGCALQGKRDALPQEPAPADAAVTVAVRLPDGTRCVCLPSPELELKAVLFA